MFELEDLLVQIYVQELLSMVMKIAIIVKMKINLPAFYNNNLESKLRASESLGKTQEKYGDFLTPLTGSHISQKTCVLHVFWERSRTMTHAEIQDKRTLGNLMKLLKEEVMAEEMMLTRIRFGAHHNKRQSM